MVEMRGDVVVLRMGKVGKETYVNLRGRADDRLIERCIKV